MIATSSKRDEPVQATRTEPAEERGHRPARLHQPWRAWVAVGELVLTGLALWLAFVVWSDAVTRIPLSNGETVVTELTRYHGDLIALAIGLGLVAALLALDAARQLLLAWRGRSHETSEPWPEMDEDL